MPLTTREFAVPSALHEALGKRQTTGAIAAIIAAVMAFLLLWGPELFSASGWRHWMAALLAIDIVAGAVANFTRGTNDFYMQRPLHRWGFIAIHVHILLIGWLLGWDIAPVFWVWFGTILGASIVNLTGNKPFIGGLFLAIGLMALPILGLGGLEFCLSAAFFLKVTYSFAVNHYATKA